MLQTQGMGKKFGDVEDWRQKYSEITLGVITSENEADRVTRYQPVRAYLERVLGVQIKWRTATDYAGIIEGVKAKKIELARFGPASYAQCWIVTQGAVQPLVGDVDEHGTFGYHSVVLVKTESPYQSVVGLGPFAGIMTIVMSDTGTLAKLFAEAIENVDRRPVERIRATGGNRLQVMRFGILPQVFPVMLSNVLCYFESNTRSATILGVVGAGGIGLQLTDRIRVNNWDEACFIILLVLLTVSLIDMLSKAIRLRLINHPETRA